MQQLHLVGFTADRDGLIFSTRRGTKSGGFVVPVDKKLLAKLEELQDGGDDGAAERPSRRPSTRPESGLNPREMQARLRAGRTVAQVAREAGVDEEWVERFAAPILAEQARIIEHARGLVFAKARLGQSAQPLGEAVRWNSYERGMRVPEDVFDGCWSAAHLRDGDWVVRFAYSNRSKTQHAEWEVDLREGTLTSRNRLATELGFVEPGRRLKRPPAVGDGTTKVVGEPPPAAAAPSRAKRSGRRTAGAKAQGRTTAKRARKAGGAKQAAGAKKARTPRSTGARATAPTRASGTKKATATTKASGTKKAATKKATTKASATKKASRRAPAPKAPARAAARKAPARKAAAARRAGGRKAAAAKAPAASQALVLRSPLVHRSLGTRSPSRLPPAAALPPRATSTPVPPRRPAIARADGRTGAIAAPPPVPAERRVLPVRPLRPRGDGPEPAPSGPAPDELPRPLIRLPQPSPARSRSRPLRAR